RNRNCTAPPRKGIGEGREPEVDRVAADGAAGVCGDAFPVPRDAQARPERDDGGVDGDYAVTDGGTGRGGPGGGRTGRRDGERAGRGGRLRRDRLRFVDDASGVRVEGGELPLREPAVVGERGEVADSGRACALERRSGCAGARFERLRLAHIRRERGRELDEL